MIQGLGFAAAALTALAFLPQVVKVWRTRSAGDLSTIMLGSQGLGVSLWVVYGAAISSTPIIVSNLLTLALVVLLAYAKTRFGAGAGLAQGRAADERTVAAPPESGDSFPLH